MTWLQTWHGLDWWTASHDVALVVLATVAFLAVRALLAVWTDR